LVKYSLNDQRGAAISQRPGQSVNVHHQNPRDRHGMEQNHLQKYNIGVRPAKASSPIGYDRLSIQSDRNS
jgi:hypothetical protein